MGEEEGIGDEEGRGRGIGDRERRGGERTMRCRAMKRGDKRLNKILE